MFLDPATSSLLCLSPTRFVAHQQFWHKDTPQCIDSHDGLLKLERYSKTGTDIRRNITSSQDLISITLEIILYCYDTTIDQVVPMIFETMVPSRHVLYFFSPRANDSFLNHWGPLNTICDRVRYKILYSHHHALLNLHRTIDTTRSVCMPAIM